MNILVVDDETAFLESVVRMLRLEAAHRLLDLYEREGNLSGAEQMARAIVDESASDDERAYARWKLAAMAEREGMGKVRDALAHYEAIARAPGPIPEDLVRERIDRLRKEADRFAEALTPGEVVFQFRQE